MTTNATGELTTGTITARDVLADVIARNGPISAARVSSAQASGAAKLYSYWGVAPYEIRLRKSDGVPTAVAVGRAGSDRRSTRLAEQDLHDYCTKHGCVPIESIGELTERAAEDVLAKLAVKLGGESLLTPEEQASINEILTPGRHNENLERPESRRRAEVLRGIYQRQALPPTCG